MRRALAGCSLAIGLTVAATARAGGGPATDSYEDIDRTVAVDGRALLDVYAQHDLDEPRSRTVGLRELDPTSERAALGLFRLTLAHHPGRVGFRLDVGAGDVTDAFALQDPAHADHPTAARWLSHVEQAFVTVVVPVGRDLVVDVGKFGTPVGLEDNEAWTGWSYSRSLLYTWAEPSLHAGLRVSTRLARALSVAAFWVDGWNATFVDGNGLRSGALAVALRPRDGLEIVVVDMAGLEHSPTGGGRSPLTLRNLLDAYATFTPVPRLGLSLAFDWGVDEAMGGVSWWGLCAAARLAATDWLAFAGRAEYLADPDGFVTGTRQHVVEGTATVELATNARGARLLLRVELRHDESDVPFFEGAAPSSLRGQTTLAVALLARL